MEIYSGKIHKAQRVVVYGPEGIGKSTFAACFPKTLFSDVEGGTLKMDVRRFKRPESWAELLEQAKYVRDNPHVCDTYAIDTIDRAEALASAYICARGKVKGIEDYAYGKGYTYIGEEIGRFLNLLDEIVDRGVNVVITAHAKMRKVEQPDEMGAYDRWEMKLTKFAAPLIKEWADLLLFANYKTYVVAADDSGKKHKAQGGKRVMYTSHHPCWDAKNRDGLAEELPFDYLEIQNIIPDGNTVPTAPATEQAQSPAPSAASQQIEAIVDNETAAPVQPQSVPNIIIPPEIPSALAALMRENGVSEEEIRKVVADSGYYPESTQISVYDSDFINAMLIGTWSQVFELIKQNREVPFS